MNNFVKNTLGAGKKKMVDIVSQMDRAHMRLRNNQVRDDFNTMNSFPVIETHLEDLEGHAASTYTYDVYKWVKKEVMKEKFLVTKGFQAAAEDDHSVHKMANFKRQQYVHEVVYYHGRLTTDEEALEEAVLPPIMVCTCNMFQYKGVPCRHMFMLMKQENMSKIPRSLIMKRWTWNAGSVCDIEYPDGQNMDKEALEPERTGCVIRDPVVVKKKGNQNQETGRRPITCSYCKGAGHNIQSCGERKEKEKEAAAQQSVGEDNPPIPTPEPISAPAQDENLGQSTRLSDFASPSAAPPKDFQPVLKLSPLQPDPAAQTTEEPIEPIVPTRSEVPPPVPKIEAVAEVEPTTPAPTRISGEVASSLATRTARLRARTTPPADPEPIRLARDFFHGLLRQGPRMNVFDLVGRAREAHEALIRHLAGSNPALDHVLELTDAVELQPR
ncbi:hypothetical protein ACLB2K_015889 [Fragaria x ananassa]